MKKEVIAPGIIRYSDVLLESDELIDFINNDFMWVPGTAAESRNNKSGYENVRKVNTFTLTDEDGKPPASSLKEWAAKVHWSLSWCQADYTSHYDIDTVQHKNSGYQVLSYGEGDYFSKHTDEIPEQNRKISGVYYVNDDYEGGELYFTEFDIVFKPKAKDYLLFPSIWSYMHIAKPVISGTKNAIVHFIYQVRWSSGYLVCLSRRRTRVRIPYGLRYDIIYIQRQEKMGIPELFDTKLQQEKFAELIAEKVIKKLEEREDNDRA